MSAPLHIPLFNSIEVDLPAWFAVPTKNFGNPRNPVWFALANPMTTSRNISNRKHEHSINIRRRTISEPHIEKNSWDNHDHPIGYYTSQLTEEHFAPIDQARIEKMKEHPNTTFSNYPVIARGRPEKMEANITYNRHHKSHTREQKYGQAFLNKVKETLKGKPVANGEALPRPSPASSRTPSRLSSLASSLRSSKPSKAESESESSSSEEDSDSGSSSESDEESEAGKNVFRPNAPRRRVVIEEDSSSSSGSSKSSKSKSSRPSVSRGKPPLKRPEVSQNKIKKAMEREAKKKANEEAKEAKKKAREEAKEAKEKEKAEKPKGKSKGAKPTSSQGDAPIVKQARGRAPKYATKAEAYEAKLAKNREWKERAKAKKAEAEKPPEPTTEGEGIKLITTELPVEKKKRGRPKKVKVE